MDKKEIVKRLVSQELGKKDHEDLIDLLINNPISVDVDKEQEANTTFGEKMADRISAIAGSWFFIMFCILFLILWIILNVFVLTEKIDPYPFILLNLVLSCISAIQAPIIMMSQNREAKRDSLRSKNDYRTDLKSELILEELHDKMEELEKLEKEILKELENKRK